MRNCIIVYLLVLLLYTLSYSQFFSDYGMKAGITASKTVFEYEPSINIMSVPFDKTRISPNIGIFCRFYDIKIMDLELQLLYIQKGGEEEFEITTLNQPNGTGEILIFDIQFEYLQLQLGIRPKYSRKKIEIYGYLGVSFDYLLEVKGIGSPKSSFKDTIWGYALGCGITFNELLNHPIFIETVYNSDLSETYKSESPKINNSSLLIKLGVGLNKK